MAAVVDAAPGQPYASNWHPAQLVGWHPRSEPAAPFMRSTQPLVDRVVDRWTRANPDARPRRVLACSVFANTDGNPAQGAAEFDYYTSEFWPYVDTLIFWGGSASEGLVLAPNPTVVDAAHRNGVPVYGTIFFPPNVYGGQLQWVRDLLQRDADGFPVARSLAAIARHYGFEGWFVNQETSGADPALAGAMADFLAELRDLGSRVLWYDAMVESGAVSWQGALNASNDAFFAPSDLMFLDFRWSSGTLVSSAAYADGMGRTADELFAGIDTGARQFGVQGSMDVIFPATGGSGVGVALYRPDFTLTGTGDPSQYAARESRFWVGSDGDPSSSAADAEGWRGMSSKISEHAVITSLPFVTSFGTGHGTQWSRKGRRWQSGEWNNLSAQDVLPTWRWLTAGTELVVGYDYDRAWQGGSSLMITGDLDEPATLALFATRAEITATTTLEVVALGEVGLQAVVRFLDAPAVDVAVPLGAAGEGWTRLRSAELVAHAGRTMIQLGLRLERETDGEVDVRVGALSITDGRAPRPRRPRKVTARPSGPGTKIRWRGEPGLRHEVEAVCASGARHWLGTTTAEAFYAPSVPTGTTRIEVVPVAADGRRGPRAGVPLEG